LRAKRRGWGDGCCHCVGASGAARLTGLAASGLLASCRLDICPKAVLRLSLLLLLLLLLLLPVWLPRVGMHEKSGRHALGRPPHLAPVVQHPAGMRLLLLLLQLGRRPRLPRQLLQRLLIKRPKHGSGRGARLGSSLGLGRCRLVCWRMLLPHIGGGRCR